MKKYRLILILLMLGAGLVIIYIKWNRPHSSVEAANGIHVNAATLFQQFSDNEQLATKTYNGKVVEITGVVGSTSTNQEVKTIVQLQSNDLLFGINCTMENETTFKGGDTVTLKGICSGFTSDVILVRCYLIKKTT